MSRQTVVGFIGLSAPILLALWNTDIWIVAIFLLISIGLFMISSRTSYRTFWRLVSLYLFLNFILFPLSYLLLLNFQPNSFDFAEDVKLYERNYKLNDLQSRYKPMEIKAIVELINRLVTDIHGSNLSMRDINCGSALVLPGYVLVRKPSEGEGCFINVYQKGILISVIPDNVTFGSKDIPLRQFLNITKNDFNLKWQNYLSEKRDITLNNKIWTYRQLLGYTLNIWSNSNMVPKSSFANLFVWLHNTCVGGGVFVLIMSFIFKFIERNPKKTSLE